MVMGVFIGFKSAAGEELPKAWVVIDPFPVVFLLLVNSISAAAAPNERSRAGGTGAGSTRPAAPCAPGLVHLPTLRPS